MSIFSEHIWQRFRRSLGGRLFAAALIAAPVGAFATAEVSPAPSVVIFAMLGASLLGVVAVGLLEFRDRRRNRSAEWNQRIARTTKQVRELYPDISAEHAPEVARTVEESRLTPVVWAGMALGGFSMLCGAAMLVARVVQYFRGP